MNPGIQELVALAIVVLIVGFALYRRLRKGRAKSAGYDTPSSKEEKTVHFYRRDSR